MNILLVVTGLPDKKSPARSVFNLSYAKELLQQGNNVTILYLRAINPKRPLIKNYNVNGISSFEVCCLLPRFGPVKNSTLITALFKQLLRNRELRKSLVKSDIFHAISGGAVEACYLVSKKYCKPMISQFIGSDVNTYLSNFLTKKNFLKGIEESAYLCFNSNGLRDVFVSRIGYKDKAKVLYRGVKLVEFIYNFHKSDNVNILFLGGFPNNGNLKGGHTLLETIKLLDKKHVSNIITFIIGGPNALNYSNLVKEIGSDNIKLDFIGAVNKETVKEKMNQSHIIVIPSIAEGLPNVLYEAMASGNMVIGTNVGGIPEILEPGITGELIPANDPTALMEAILKSISTNEYIEECAVNGRNKIEEMDYNKFIEGYLNIYREFIEEENI